ncbi:MAG: MFS transporter [Burkholderiales bacterium]|nr:MFS transporter [Burkholderiales bacterium]
MSSAALPNHARTAIAVLALCLILNLIGRGVADTYVVFLLPLENDLGWTRSQMTGVYAVYLMVNGLTAPLIGLLFDRVGPRLIYTLGLACLGVAYLLAARVENMWQFYLTVGAMTGMAVSALGMVPSSSLIARWFRERLSTALSVAFAGLGLGALIIVPATQALLQNIGWRETYQVLGITLLALVLPLSLLPWRGIAAGRPDYRRERKTTVAGDADWTLRRAARTPTFWGLMWMFFMTSVGMFAVTVQTVAYLVDQGYAALLAASAFGVASMLSVFGIVLTGMLADRFGARRVATSTYVGSGLGILVLLVISWHPLPALLVVYVIVFGSCQGARGPIISSMTTRLFAGPQVGLIYGVMYAANAFGAGLGSVLAGVMHDATGNYRVGFVFSIMCLIAAALPLWRIPAMRDFRTRGGAGPAPG